MKRLRLSAALACAAALLAALPALAPASVQVGSSGWQWGNPLPQGNTLRSISFAGANGYAAGDFGTLLRTTDGGTTWSGLLSGTFTNLAEVQAIDARRGLRRRAAASRGAPTTAAPPSRAWPSRPVESSCKEQFAAGWFVNRVTGFLALTDGTILRTDNNGDTFAQKNPLPGTRAPGRHGDAGRRALPHRPDRRRRDLRRQDLPHHRRRQLVDPGQRHHPRRALVLLPRREQRLRRRRRLALPRHQGRRRDLDAEGHRHPADQPALDPVRDADAVRDDDRAGHGARAHRRRRRHAPGSSRPRRTRSSRRASPRPRASPRAARPAPRRSPTTRG